VRPATFPIAEAFMAFIGLVPGQYPAGSTHLRNQLIEAAWA